MSTSSLAASSTITRSRIAIATCITITAVAGIYYLNSTVNNTSGPGDAAPPGHGLHRSNAIHRRTSPIRRRRRRRGSVGVEMGDDSSSDSAPPRISRNNDGFPPAPVDLETVVDDAMDLDDDEWPNDEPPNPRRGQNVVQLLFRVSEEATRQSSYVHRGCHCDSCGTVPIRGIRYRCSNCADYDLCEACEAQQLHTKTHIFYKIRVPAYSFSSRQSQPPCYPGQPDTALSQLPKQLIAKLSKETSLERQEIYAYWEQFTFMANTEWRDDPDGLCLAMDRVTFDQCLIPSGGWRSVAPNLIFDRMFAFYDTNHDGLISFPEFLNGLAFRKKKDKLRKIFEGYDIDGDGFVDRKDFLRMFRSYYTMYKALNQEFLESLNDHTMSRTEAQQLISGRQPLSSLFARELPISGGGIRDARAGEGKQVIYDELEVTDGDGVTNESGKDQADRMPMIYEHDLRRRGQGLHMSPLAFDSRADTGVAQIDLNRQIRREPSFAPDADVRDAHWEAMMNPPQSLDELHHNLLDNLILTRQENAETRRPPIIPSNVLQRLRELGDSGEDHELRDELLRGSFNTCYWPPEFVRGEDVEAACGQSMPMAEVPEDSRFDVIRQAVRRRRLTDLEEACEFSEKVICERWKRRQFYTDEEEGFARPDFFNDEEDIPEEAKIPRGLNTTANSPPPMLSPRSRSSSKVRFAEDTDDFDVRSNYSTSSRSIPERWGGMEIPEAEKDAGKDILYQTTQLAFNELLDPLFKVREDMAMNVMATRKERDKYRHLFTKPSFENWASQVDQNADKKPEDMEVMGPIQEMEAGIREGEGGESLPTTDDIQNVRNQPVEELLAASGYRLRTFDQPDRPEIEEDKENTTPDQEPSDYSDNKPENSDTSPEVEEEYIDPTLPQNRPNSILPTTITEPPTPTPPKARFSKTFNEEYVAETVAPWSSSSKEKIPSRSRLYLLRNHDRYEAMAKEMGGWGRLNFKEWEGIVKGEGRDGSSEGNVSRGRFDYLGGWIDICIP